MSAIEEPLISFLVPVYNCADTIRDSLSTVLTTTDVPLQVVVVDDASTDDTARILGEMAESDNRITVVYRSENGGEGPARNSSLAAAKGQWIAFLDADDQIVDGAINKLGVLLPKTVSDVVITRMFFDDVFNHERRRVDEAFMDDIAGIPTKPAELSSKLFTTVGSTLCNKVMRRSFIEEKGIRFLDVPRVADISFTFSACALAERIEFADIDQYNYVINHGASLTWTMDRYPLCFAEATYEVKRCLDKYGVWPIFQKDFLNWLSGNVVNNFNSMSSLEGYLALAQEFHDHGFEELGLDSLDRQDCTWPDRYDVCMSLWKEGVTKGLWVLFRILQNDSLNTIKFLKAENTSLKAELLAKDEPQPTMQDKPSVLKRIRRRLSK